MRDTDFYHHFDNKSSDSATAGIGGGALGDPEVWWEAGPGFSVIARSGLLPLLFRLINADEVHFLERVGPIDIRLLDTAQPFGSGGSHFGADQHPMLTRFPSSAPCNRISDDRGTDGKHRRLEEVSFAFLRADAEVCHVGCCTALNQ